MSIVNTVALIINSVTIALSLVMLALLLWQDSRTASNLFFSVLMLMVVIWASGNLLSRISAYTGGVNPLTSWGVRLLEIGFTGSCVGVYIFTVVLTGGQGRTFLRLAIVGIALFVAYQTLITFSGVAPTYQIHDDGSFNYAFEDVSTIIYLAFTFSTVFITWQRQRKVKGKGLLAGIYMFCLGLLIELISPQLRSRAIGMDISAVAALMLSYAMVRAQIIEPLSGRANQLQAVRDVGLAITSRVQLQEVLSTVAGQAAAILQANGAAIFLNRDGVLELAAVHNMPNVFLTQRLAIGDGVAGRVAASRQSMRIENYRRDWAGVPDMPLAKQAFGSVIAAPLIFGDEVMGVLFVVEGPYGKRFDRDDMRLLELLGPQAAVAITNSRLFERQRALTNELEAAKNQLETLLTSTENPVIALNRRLEVIFINPAAMSLLKGNTGRLDLVHDAKALSGRPISEIVPPNIMPRNPLHAARELYRRRVHTYELVIKDRTYLCHLGLLGRPRPQGYVAVLNDISELKELDRLKNQMIRMTSHDLKNPLTAAMMVVDNLEDEGEGILSQQMQTDIGEIRLQLQRMHRIIGGILDLERVQNGPSLDEECSIERMIRLAVNEFSDQVIRRGIELRTNVPDGLLPITGNSQHLTQALSNLVENAIKFTRSGGRVTISAEMSAEESYVIIHVADTGIGIPLESQTRVFERFFRANHPGMEQISGTGLGLSLVKSVVDGHKGQIWLESEVGKGTTFHMALPVRQAMPSELRKILN